MESYLRPDAGPERSAEALDGKNLFCWRQTCELLLRKRGQNDSLPFDCRGTGLGGFMNIGRWLIRMLKLLAPPVILASVAAFFVWHASHGDRGLIAREQRIVDIAQAKAERDSAVAHREAAERRVNAMRGDRLDRDQLEERARAMLNLTTREEIVIPYPPGQRLF